MSSALSMMPLILLVSAQTESQPAGDQQQPTPQAAERRICRAMNQPGSLAGSRRVCMTRAEWDQAAETARRESQEVMAGMDSCSSRAEGGTGIGGGPSQQTASAMARMSGC